MTGPWEGRKTKSRFPSLSTAPWKSQTARFPHSHHPAAEARGKVEIQNRDFHFPTGSNSSLKIKKQNQQKSPEGRSLRSLLQAHSSMKKCHFSQRQETQKNIYHVLDTMYIPCASLDRHSCRCFYGPGVFEERSFDMRRRLPFGSVDHQNTQRV